LSTKREGKKLPKTKGGPEARAVTQWDCAENFSTFRSFPAGDVEPNNKRRGHRSAGRCTGFRSSARPSCNAECPTINAGMGGVTTEREPRALRGEQPATDGRQMDLVRMHLSCAGLFAHLAGELLRKKDFALGLRGVREDVLRHGTGSAFTGARWVPAGSYIFRQRPIRLANAPPPRNRLFEAGKGQRKKKIPEAQPRGSTPRVRRHQ